MRRYREERIASFLERRDETRRRAEAVHALERKREAEKKTNDRIEIILWILGAVFVLGLLLAPFWSNSPGGGYDYPYGSGPDAWPGLNY